MTRLFIVALSAVLTLITVAQAQLGVSSNWYWTVGDSNPTTQVWSANAGVYVSNTDSSYETFLGSFAASLNSGIAVNICGVANDGGLVQIQVCNPALIGAWVTGQTRTVFGIGGVTGANGARVITVVNATLGFVDLQGSTFGGAYTSGGVIGAAALIDTDANKNIAINNLNLSRSLAGVGYGYQILTLVTDTALTNPVTRIIAITAAGSGLTLNMPQANVPGSLPIGVPVLIINTSGNAVGLRDFTNGTIVGNMHPGETWQIMLRDNSNTTGLYAAAVMFNAPGLTCGSFSGSAASTNGLVTHC